MEIKAKDMCPKCKHCLGMTPQGMYSCGYANDGSELNIGIDVVLNCANFEWDGATAEGKAKDWCSHCRNASCEGYDDGKQFYICEDPYDGNENRIYLETKISCSMYEPGNCPSYEEKKREEEPCDKISLLQHELEMDKLRRKIHELEKEKAAHMKGIERLKKSNEKLQNQIKNLQITNEESYKREEKLEDKVHKLERRLHEERKSFNRFDTELLTPLARVLYPREAKICKPYSEVIEDIKRLVDKSEILEQRYDNIHYTLYKDWSDDSISCPRDIPSEVEMIEGLKKKAAESDYYKEKSELLEESRNAANRTSDLWKERSYKWEAELNDKTAKLNQTISDQEITIKALLLTIKEMCKDE